MTGTPQYLLAIYRAERRDGPPVPSGAVAETLDRSPAAATEMLGRLEDRGLVTHEPYEGATLTADGRAVATELYGNYRTLSRFFEQVLGLDDHEAEAMELAGAVSPAVVDRLAATLLPDDETGDEAVASSVPPDGP